MIRPLRASRDARSGRPGAGTGAGRRLLAKLSAADEERLLLGEKGLTAFIVAEMEHYVNTTMVGLDTGTEFRRTRWVMPDDEKLQLGLSDETGAVANEEYAESREEMEGNEGGPAAVGAIRGATEEALREGFSEQGLFSSLGSAILFFRGFFRTPRVIAACERVGLSDYEVAHHITDMYHHRNFRGAYTKTLEASGKGEAAARAAVGLLDDKKGAGAGGGGSASNRKRGAEKKSASAAAATTSSPPPSSSSSWDEEDECVVWSPTNPDVCIHWKSDDEAWRKRRFERIQMEGTKDPRRGGSGTTR